MIDRVDEITETMADLAHQLMKLKTADDRVDHRVDEITEEIADFARELVNLKNTEF